MCKGAKRRPQPLKARSSRPVARPAPHTKADAWLRQNSLMLAQHARRVATRVARTAGSASGSSSASCSLSTLSHVDASGQISMVDISGKKLAARTAVAGATVHLGADAFRALNAGENAKGNVLATARIAGILAAKRTSDLIPLCHQIALAHVGVELTELPEAHALEIRASATCTAGTGVEMEALTAASVAALTVYDMCKAAHKGITISDIRLLSKSGGKSGEYVAPGQ